jgi:hypothetical protein
LCKENSLRKTCAIAFTLIIYGAVCHAQIPIPKSGNAFFGYSYSKGQVVNGSAIGINMNGWEGTLEGKFLPWLGGIADFDWHYGGANTACLGTNCTPPRFRLNGSRHSVLFGPRASISMGKYRPFAQALFGFTHQTSTGGGNSASDLAFSTEAGAGMDYKLLESVAWRVQGDWIRTRLFGVGQTDFRISTGIAFRF